MERTNHDNIDQHVQCCPFDGRTLFRLAYIYGAYYIICTDDEYVAGGHAYYVTVAERDTFVNVTDYGAPYTSDSPDDSRNEAMRERQRSAVGGTDQPSVSSGVQPDTGRTSDWYANECLESSIRLADQLHSEWVNGAGKRNGRWWGRFVARLAQWHREQHEYGAGRSW